MQMKSYTITVIMQEGMPDEIIHEQLRQSLDAKFIKITDPTPEQYHAYAKECEILIRDAERKGIWKARRGRFGNIEVGLTKQGEQCRKAVLS
jgi:hypothetical protein